MEPDKYKWAKTYDEFLNVLGEHEISTTSKFVIVCAPSKFNAEKVIPVKDQRIYWQDDVPYLYFSSRTFDCHQGKDLNIINKKKYANKRDSKAITDHCFTKRYHQAQTTKKLNCPAKVIVKRVIRIPELKLSAALKTKYEKEKISQIIKRKISDSEEFGEECYLFNLPSMEMHKNHLVGVDASITEPVDSRVRNYICQLVNRGERNPSVILKLVEFYVTNELQEQDKMRRRFYPTLSTVRQIISAAKIKVKKSPIDQENVEMMLNKLDGSKHNIFYRTSLVGKYEEEEDSSLLFVYQSSVMKRLYEKYGKNTIMLDATYRTCKYALPLYFLVVETNVNFQIVGVIITQYETKEAITEGLNVFKGWNPEVHPKYAMVDYAYEEISSLETVFPDISVFICSFHREQAWHRWFSRASNSAIPKKEALSLLRKIAFSGPGEELQSAIAQLQSWEYYSTSTLKCYFEGTWLKELPRWATAFKPLDMHK